MNARAKCSSWGFISCRTSELTGRRDAGQPRRITLDAKDASRRAGPTICSVARKSFGNDRRIVNDKGKSISVQKKDCFTIRSRNEHIRSTRDWTHRPMFVEPNKNLFARPSAHVSRYSGGL